MATIISLWRLKLKDKSMKINILILTLSLLFLSSCNGCLPEVGLNRSAHKFDSKIWKEADKEGGVREEMCDDLLKNILKTGTDKKIVLEKLGQSDNNSYQYLEKNQLVYLVSKGFDPCFLVFSFDENNKLILTNINCS